MTTTNNNQHNDKKGDHVMHAIWKYSLEHVGRQVLRMPRGAKILCVQTQAGSVQLWALVDVDAPMDVRVIVVQMTGHQMEKPNSIYIGTCQLQSGIIVLHVFEEAG